MVVKAKSFCMGKSLHGISNEVAWIRLKVAFFHIHDPVEPPRHMKSQCVPVLNDMVRCCLLAREPPVIGEGIFQLVAVEPGLLCTDNRESLSDIDLPDPLQRIPH